MSDPLRLLDDLQPPDPDARDRAWRLVGAAYARRPVRRRSLGLRRPAAVAVALAAGTVAALSPAGASVARLVRQQATPAAPRPAPPRPAALSRLPGGGKLLVVTASATYSLGDGHGVQRVAGAADDAAWSAFGRFVVLARGRELAVNAAGGRRVWQLVAPAPVRGVAWSPDGNRIAYTAGRLLRVVAGDGTGDRAVGRAGAVTAAWRPQHGHELVYADRDGAVVLVDGDSGRRLWRVHVPPRLRQLTWSADGRRLIALSARRALVIGEAGRVAHRGSTPRAGEHVAVVPAPVGNAFLTLDRAGDEERVTLVRVGRRGQMRRRALLTAPGIGAALWSPDGRWVLVDWRQKGTWLFLSARGGRAARTIDRVPSHFGLGEPIVAGWCCRP